MYKILRDSFKISMFLLTLITGFVISINCIAAEETFKFKVDNDWGSGFTGKFTVKNTTASTLKNWQVKFDLPYDITDIWSAQKISKVNNTYTVGHPPWKPDLSPGESYSFGFNATPGNVNVHPTNVLLSGEGGNSPNSPPIANNDTIITNENTPKSALVLNNDTDQDNDLLTITATTSPQYGTAEISSNSVLYTPNTGFKGTDLFSYSVTDGKGGTDSAEVTVFVNSQQQETFTITASAIGGSISDYPEFTQPMAGDTLYMKGDKVTYKGSSYESLINNNSWSPTNYPAGWKTIQDGGSGKSVGSITPGGTIIVTKGQSQTFTFTPETDNTVKDVAVDGNSIGKPLFYTFDNVNADHSITVEFERSGIEPPSPPVANADNVYTTANTAVEITPLANDTDKNSNSLIIASTTPPANGTLVINGKNITYTPKNNFSGSDTFNYTIQNSEGLTATALITVFVRNPSDLNKKIVGYWQNWTEENPADYIQFRDISPKYNIINIAFAKPKSDTDSTIEFKLDTYAGTSEAEFKSLIKQYQAEGRKVLISLGGQKSPALQLNTENDKIKFVNSLINIIDEYAFNGVDIDLENSSVKLNSGDKDFKNPTTPSMINLIAAIKQLKAHYGNNFILTTAPETAYVQGGISGYDGFWGAYLPLLYGLRNDIDMINVQYYNSGTIFGTDGKLYYEGTPDFVVALTEALLTGFEVNRNPNNIFPAFRPDQVGVGILTSEREGTGDMYSEAINKALNYLTKGIPFGGKYVLDNPDGYLDLAGIMGWSMTVDKRDHDNEFIDNAYNYFYGSDPIPNRVPATTDDNAETLIDTPVTINVLDNDTDADNDTLTIASVETPQNGSTAHNTDSITYTPDKGFTGTDTFNYTVIDGNGGSASALVTVTVNTQQALQHTITASVADTVGNSYPEFVQPMAGGSLYMKDDRVTFNDSSYESLIDNNSWSPANYPGGWKTIADGGSNAGGTITPDGISKVNEGESQTFTILPDSDSVIKDVKVDSISVGKVSTYTFSDINTDHTISAEFESTSSPIPNNPPTITFAAPKNNKTITQSALSPIAITINAQDSDGTVKSVVIKVDNQTFNNSTASWTPSSFGYHVINVTVTDNDGAASTVQMSVRIVQDNLNPDPDPEPNPTIGEKQVIGYFTQWEGWYKAAEGYPEEGTANQLNIDYSKFTMLNYSFFGVAVDGSLHSGDYRNKKIWKPGIVQEPNNLLHSGRYDSWYFWYLFGELDFKSTLSNKMIEEGYIIQDSNWSNTKTGLKGTLPIPVSKEGGAPGLIKLCKENSVKLMASIGGWSMCKHFPEMAADPIKKTKFLEGVKYLMNIGFDGIDIDWEYPGSEGMNIESFSDADYANFTALMRDIRAVIGQDKLLTAAFSCDPAKLEKLEWSQLDMTMDYYNMMTYDMNGGWSDVAGHNSLLYSPNGSFSWDKTYRYLIGEKGISPEKVNMGIAFYGRGVVTDGPASLGAPTKKKDLVVNPDGPVYRASDIDTWGDKYIEQPNYFFIKQETANWTHLWDDDAKVPYSVNGSSFISYDNEKSVKYKADYINDNQLGGVIIWHVTGDWEVGSVTATYGGKLKKAQVTTPLLDVIYKTFTSNSDDPEPVTANYAFPQHVNYPLPHILPNNYTQDILDNDVKSFYDYWKQNYVISAGIDLNGENLYRVNYQGDTVSEGQGYGMIITAIMAGYDPEAKEIFDGLFRYAKAHPSNINSNFMDWSLTSPLGDSSAFDGDADIAYALLIADKQWVSVSGFNYKSEAQKIIIALRNNLFSDMTSLPLLGDWVNKNDPHYGSLSRTSDFMPANFKAYGSIENSDTWNAITADCISKLQYLQNNFSSDTGLVPDFIKNGMPVEGKVLEDENDGNYDYNACRVPLRIGVYALLNNDVSSKAIVEKISKWAETKTSGNPADFKAGYTLDGNQIVNYSATSFTSPMGVAAMCSGQQAWLNKIYEIARRSKTNYYYEDTLNMISLLIMTGNFWDSSIVQ
ncbi:MAG TPA: glycosyl hydrolase family 8 [Victivallales bacterium]|nr:glycosyl hydrolase family 8 [Victivallales bacterium]